MKTQFLLCGDIGCVSYSADQRSVSKFRSCKPTGLRFSTGCLGFCAVGPVLGESRQNFYQKVKPADVPKILEAAQRAKCLNDCSINTRRASSHA